MHVYHTPPEYYTGSNIKIPTSYAEAVRMTFSSSGPITSFVLIAFGTIARIWLGHWSMLDLIAIVILIGGWAFIEWGLHYYVLHAYPLPFIQIRLRSVLSRLHTQHHKDPWDPATIYFKGPTILGGWIITTLLLSLALPVGPALTFSTSLLLMVERHQWVHLLVHSKVPVKSKYLQKIISTHIKHHTIDGRKWMGVSAYLADDVFGTNK